MCVDVKKKAMDERLAEVDIFFFIVELIFPNVDENILKVDEFFPAVNKKTADYSNLTTDRNH